MLNPDSRLVAFDLLVPPPEMQLELGVFTTYTLDLEVMLTLPLQLLACSTKDIESLHESPIQLLEALRQAGEKIHVFVDRSGIAVPHSQRALYSALESSLHPVRVPSLQGVFHPKLWILKFVPEKHGPTTIRLAVLSRNLTLARTWDLQLSSEGTPNDDHLVDASSELANLISALPGMCTGSGLPLSKKLHRQITNLASEISRTAFTAPAGFHSEPIQFHALGLSGKTSLWKPFSAAERVLAVAPFANATALKQIPTKTNSQNILIGRQPELDSISEENLEVWQKKYVLHDLVEESEPDDFVGHRMSGLHAKLLVYEHGETVSWLMGSANLTSAAFSGSNVEIMARLSAPLPKKNTENSNGITQFMESGNTDLLKDYVRLDNGGGSGDELKRKIEATRDAILNADLSVRCKDQHKQTSWTWRLEGKLHLPHPEMSVKAWPITIDDNSARRIKKLPLDFPLTTSELTSLVAFHLQDPRKEVDDISFVLNLPTIGLPPGRIHHILVNLLSDWERFRAFLRALLGGFDALEGWDSNTNHAEGNWSIDPWNAESLLEDLVRSASRDPERLEPIRRLVTDIRKTEKGKKIIPDEFLKLWNAVVDSVPKQRDRS